MKKNMNTLNNPDYNNNFVGTNTIQKNSDIEETIAFKGSYSNKILFPILATSKIEKPKIQETKVSSLDNRNKNNYNSFTPKRIVLRQRQTFNNSAIQISDPEDPVELDDINSSSPDQHQVPSYLVQILAPPTPFAEGSKWAGGESANKNPGFELGRYNNNWECHCSNYEGSGLNESENCTTWDLHCERHQQQQHPDHLQENYLSQSPKLDGWAGDLNLEIRTPTITALCANFQYPSFSSQELEFSCQSFDEMGWGQPNVGKRVRQDSPNPNQQNENHPDHNHHNHNSGYSASESETDEEIRGHLIHKRSRDVSPVRSTPGLMDFAKVNTVPLNVNSSVNALSVCRVQFKPQSDDENVSYVESIEPISSLSSESCHSVSVTSTTSHTMLSSSHLFSNSVARDVELGHISSSKQVMDEDDDEAQYLDNSPSDCFLGPHGNVIFPPPPPVKHQHRMQSSRNFSQQPGTVDLTTINEQQQQPHVHSRFSMVTPMGCPPPPTPTLPDKFLTISHTKPIEDNMVVRESGILRSSTTSITSGSGVSADSSSNRHPGEGAVENAKLSAPRSVISKFKGPRVPTASKVARPSQKNLSKTHGSTQYAYNLCRAAKNPKVNATTMGKNVHESEEDEESETDADDESDIDGDGDGDRYSVTDNDNMTGLKGDEAVEDDASTSTDITLPNIVRKIVPPIRPSYFPFVPPYLNFCLHDEKSETLPNEIRKHLKWRMSTITPIVIKKTVANSGFRLLRKTTDWGGQWGKHMKGAVFRSTLKEHQKLNHLPATFQLGRKDRLWKNIYRFILKYGKSQFGFLPRTYILPHDMKQLKHAWDAAESRERMWIIKPPAGARGTGIRVINKWNQVPKKRPVIVQQYIEKPLLINDRKFDLRLYVLVTNFHPLRVYLYDDGLVRFAPVKYSHDSKRVSDRFMHLTNYSVNKNCELYTQNEDANACKGHKWTLKTLWRYMRSNGTDTEAVMKRIEDIIIKTLVSAEDCITTSAFNMPCRYNGYELFGFDIILDESLKPWLLEVNISPSLHSSSPLDLAVKGPLVKEVFNIVGYHLPPSISKHAKRIFVERLDKELLLEKPTFDRRIYCNATTKEEKNKQQIFRAKYDDRSQYLTEILDSLTPDDIRHLIVAEDELSQCNGFNRIFPTRSTHSYFAFFESPRYYNMLMDAWENKYEGERATAILLLQELCRRKLHLITATSGPQPICENQNLDDTFENEEDEGEDQDQVTAIEADHTNSLAASRSISVLHVPIVTRVHPMSTLTTLVPNNSAPSATTATATTLSGGPTYSSYPDSQRSTDGTGESIDVDIDIASSDERYELQPSSNPFTSATDGEFRQYNQNHPLVQGQNGSNLTCNNVQIQQQYGHGSPAAVKMERCVVIQEGGHRTTMRINQNQSNHRGPVSPGISNIPSLSSGSPHVIVAAPVAGEELEFYPHPPHTVTYHHVPLSDESDLSSMMKNNVNSNNNNNSSHASATPVPVNEYNQIKGVCY